jgi:DNA-binding protein H-NS
VFKDLKLKLPKESEQSHWYSRCKLEPTLTVEQLLEKQAKAEDRRREQMENRLYRMQKCEEKTKKIVEMMEPLVLHVNNEEAHQ